MSGELSGCAAKMSNALSLPPTSVLLEQGEQLPVQLVPVEVLMPESAGLESMTPNDPRKFHTAHPILRPPRTPIRSCSHAGRTGCGVLLWAPPSPQTTLTLWLASSAQGR
jgi:hypothetical protein